MEKKDKLSILVISDTHENYMKIVKKIHIYQTTYY